jgi:protein lifeguard
MGGYLCIFISVLLIFGIVAIFWNNPIVQLIYSCLAALLYGIYLIYDTQLVIGRGKYQYSLDDAFDAAINLYLDIIQMFLNLLRIIGAVSGN